MQQGKSKKLNIKKILVISLLIILSLLLSFLILKKHILDTSSNRAKLEYSNYIPKQSKEQTGENEITELEIFPSNYLEVVENNKFNMSQKNRVQLLRYGQTVVEDDGDGTMFSDAILKLSTNKTPILLTNQILSLYYKSVVERFKSNVIENNLQKELLRELNLISSKLRYIQILSLTQKGEVRKTTNAVNECKVLLGKNQYEECIGLLKQENISQLSFSKYIVNNKLKNIDALNSYIGIDSFLTNREGEDVFEKVLNLQSENDIEVVKKIDVNIQNSHSNNIESQIYLDLDQVLLEEMINSTEYLIVNLSDQHINTSEITELQEQLAYLRGYMKRQYTGENDPSGIKEILSSFDYNIQPSKFLLKSIKVKDENVLAVSPYIEEIPLVPEVSDSNFDEAYDYPRSALVSGRVRLPVLMYHHIATTNSTNKFVAGLYTNPFEFEKQIAYLTKKNYKTVDGAEFNTILSSGKNPEQKTVMLTFDDGTESHYTQAYPILKKYGQTGVFFVISNRLYLGREQIKEMADNGMDIQSHSQTHPDLTKVSTEQLNAEIVQSKNVLQSITGKTVTSIAYPGCVADSRAFPIAEAAGYLTGFSCGRNIDISNIHKFMIPRVHVGNGFDAFVKILSVGGY